MFPTSTRKHLKIFKTAKYRLVKTEKELGVWHAATSTKETGFSKIIRAGIGKTEVVGVGKEYLPGGFVSPSLSPYFLKVGGQPYTFMGTDLFPGTPTVAYIYPKGVAQYGGRTVSGMTDFLFGKAKKGWVYTHRASIKTEVEGLVPPGTLIRGIGKRFYVKWKSVRIPIVEFTTKVGEVGKVTTVGALPTTYVKSSIISPLGIGLLGFLSKKKEEKISKVSQVSSIMGDDYYKLSSRVSEGIYETPSMVSKISEPSKISSRISEPSKISSRISEDTSSILGDSSIVSRDSRLVSRVSTRYEPPYTPPYTPPSKKGKRISVGVKVTPKEKGFDVMVREGERRADRFKRVAKNLPRNKALRKGRDIVDNYIEATYRIKPSGRRTKVIDDLNPPDLRKFRSPVQKSKLPRDSLIELAKHRLDSAKELQQISYFKEIAARKKQALQTQISFIKTQQKKAQLQSAITTQVNFLSTPKKGKKTKQRPIRFL